jgi:hypothetical protein
VEPHHPCKGDRLLFLHGLAMPEFREAMRAAFVGLSTPLFYDYRNPASRAPSDTSSSPNPILDSPFGLMLLYDEIWFLCRSLCPENLRDAPFVRYVDEERLLPSMKDVGTPSHWEGLQTNPDFRTRYGAYEKSRRAFFDTYRARVLRAGVDWQAAADNHSHTLQIGDARFYANSADLKNLIIDMAIVNRLSRPGLELVTNSVSQGWLGDPNSPFLRTKLAEVLTIENIPNYLTSRGPYDPCIEEVRNNHYLRDFRKWISSQAVPQDEGELLEMKRNVETVIKEAQAEVFIRAFSKRRRFLSIGKTLVGTLVDFFVPGASSAESIAEDVAGYFSDRNRRWQAFVVSTRRYLPRKVSAG